MDWVPHDEPTVQRQRGKWTVRQGGCDPSTGRRKVRQLGTFDTKRAATELAKSVAAGRAGSADETVEAFVVDVWLKSKEGRVEQSTLDQYRWAVERHIVPLIGAVRLRDLTPEKVDRSSDVGSSRASCALRIPTLRCSLSRWRTWCMA